MQVATPQNELYEKLALLGWELGKVEFKNGVYVAKASSPNTGQSIERTGKSVENAIAAVYQFAARATQIRRHAALKKLGAWSTNWLDQTSDIGHAYSRMPAFDQKAVEAWKALAAESKVQADAVRKQIRVEVVDDPEPYPNAEAMCHDVHQNHHFMVSRANSEHPIWSVDDNINFRIVHDVLGHCQSGGDFSWEGENLACGVHFPLVSPLAREALFTECIGQQAYYRQYHGFGPQKVGLMSEFLHPAQAKEGEQVWVPHGGYPEIGTGPVGNEEMMYQQPGQWVQPSTVMAQPNWLQNGFNPVQSAKMVSDNNPHDPNAFYVPENQAAPVTPENDYIGIADTIDNASKIDTDWPQEDPAAQKRAIMNAFRVSLLSPRKHLKWNAAHYQAVMHADPSTKARDLWDILESAREQHNQKLGYPEGSHLAYRKQLDFLAHELQNEDPSLSSSDALKKAKGIIFEKTKEFEQMLPPEQGELSELRRYNNARKLVTDWLRQNYTPARGWQPGQMALSSLDSFHEEAARILEEASAMARDVARTLPEEEWPIWVRNNINHQFGVGVKPISWNTYDDEPGNLTLPEHWGNSLFDTAEYEPTGDWSPIDMTGFANENSKYGAFMGGHLDAIEEVGRHIDEIRDAALRDINESGGKGFIFRNAVMNMNLKGVNPKVASFAWLLLRPMSSELGIIDTHIARGLGLDGNSITPKDYYKAERMQRAAKDATGYGHVPLGIYHWGLWDAIRNPGEHSDHSPLRILDPLPWDSSDAKWDAGTTAKAGTWIGPDQFEAARGHMGQAAYDFDQEFAGQPSNMVPRAAVGV